ncbi:MAG: mannosyltransferase family protein, partial [Dehalococcoidia bacterium]
MDARRVREVLTFALAVRVGLFIVGYTAVRLVDDSGARLGDLFFDIWNRWDAPHYLRIAEVGYRDVGEDRLFLVFFPLYPLTVRAFHLVIPHYVVAGVAVSLAAAVVAGVLRYSLARLDSDDAGEPGRAVWYFFLFPTAYFLAAPYAEALFLTFVLASFLAARKGRWGWAAVAGTLATA